MITSQTMQNIRTNIGFKIMKHINDLNLKHAFIVNDKFIAIKANKRNVLKVRSKYFSNYPLLYVVLNGTRYQISDKQFDFKHGII